MTLKEKVDELEKRLEQNEDNLMKLLKSLPAIINNTIDQNNQTDLEQERKKEIEADKHMYNILNKKTK